MDRDELLDGLAKAASKQIHFERVWRTNSDESAGRRATEWRDETSRLLTLYERLG